MSTSNNQFGLMVAYLLPGFIGLAGIAPLVPPLAAWLQPATYAEASLGPPIYALLAATTLGMILSCFRWLLIDHLHRWTGVPSPTWDDNCLDDRLGGFNYLVENHYRYYQFFANTLIAVIFTYAFNRWAGTSSFLGFRTDVGAVILCAALFAGSRDALTKYYARTSRLIGRSTEKGSNTMTNGNHQDGGNSTPSKPSVEAKPKTERDVSSKSQPPTAGKPKPAK